MRASGAGRSKGSGLAANLAAASSRSLRVGKAAVGQASQERRHRVDQLQPAGLLGAKIECSAARADDGSTRCVGLIGNGTSYDVRKIELTVAVCVGTWKLEESPCRWIQLMRLGYRRMRTCPFEPELEPKLLNIGKRRTHSQGCCAATTQPFAPAFLCCGRLVGIESHVESPSGGSVG